VDLFMQDTGRAIVKATDIAIKAAELIGGDREKTHGTKQTNFENIARLWNAWFINNGGLAGQLTGADVAKLMVLLKIARMESGEFNPDDAVDAAGYAAIAGELGAPIETKR
jgi:hypothetical protein